MLPPQPIQNRNDVLDITRGIAILLIFFINVSGMGVTVFSHFNPALVRWDPLNQTTWWFLNVFIEGTPRGLLELLFGAGVLMLLDRALSPDGPVAVVDLFFRRNLWLAAFGLFDIFVIGWFGDILLEYAIGAMLVFPLRRLAPRTLLLVSVAYVCFTSGDALLRHQHASAERTQVAALLSRQAHGGFLDSADRHLVAAHAAAFDPQHPPEQVLADERAQHLGSPGQLRSWGTGIYLTQIFPYYALAVTREVFFSILLGMALFKLGITQGLRSIGFYAAMMLAAYVPGLLLRGISTSHVVLSGTPTASNEVLGEFARLAVTLGHLALINLLFKIGASPMLNLFRPAGRMAFSLYLMQNIVGMWLIFPGFALGLYGRYSWFGLSVIGIVVMLVQLVIANLWMRFFAIGPLEWVWRSLTALRPQPLHSRPVGPSAMLP